LGKCSYPDAGINKTNPFKGLSSHLGQLSGLRTIPVRGAGVSLHFCKLAGLWFSFVDTTGFLNHPDGW
jgi:hypothetical protein